MLQRIEQAAYPRGVDRQRPVAFLAEITETGAMLLARANSTRKPVVLTYLPARCSARRVSCLRPPRFRSCSPRLVSTRWSFEFRAQVNAVASAGLAPTHLDWHCLADG